MSSACDACLRRTWLLARLGGHLERAREQGRRLPVVLALSNDELLAALGGGERGRIAAELGRVVPDRAREASAGAGLASLCRCDGRYPAQLLDAPDAPAVLHVAGPLDRFLALVAAPAVAIVGTRRASPYGLEVAGSLARGLAVAGVTVVSGMAMGIDSAAHEGTLGADGGTLAVLAGSADQAYPRSARGLHRRLVEHAAVVSELPPGVLPRRWMFPARNRLIAGLSSVTVVVEGGERSGSLITAGIAEDLGRDVAAVPGRVTSPMATGPHALLADGAHLVRDATDILDLLHLPPQRVAPRPVPEELRPLLDAVAHGADTVTALALGGLEVGDALAGLTELELRGLVRAAPGGRYEVVPG